MFTRRTVIGALSLGLLLIGPITAHAAEEVVLKVSVVHATKNGDTCDPALANIQGSLTKVFGGYTAFKQLDEHELPLSQAKGGEIRLPNGKTAAFTYKGKSGSQHQIKLTIPQSKVDVDLRAPARKMFYQAGMKHDGGILILALYLKE